MLLEKDLREVIPEYIYNRRPCFDLPGSKFLTVVASLSIVASLNVCRYFEYVFVEILYNPF